MTNLEGLVSSERLQYLIFLGISLGVAGFTALLYVVDRRVFQRFLGDLNPLLVIVLVILLGAVLLTVLLSRGWFAIYKTNHLNGLLLASGLAVPLAIIIILVDRAVIFPENINVTFPQSLLFYPAIGYVVEVIFHLLPFSLLLLGLTSLFPKIDHEKIIWFCIVAAALLEPSYQIR